VAGPFVHSASGTSDVVATAELDKFARFPKGPSCSTSPYENEPNNVRHALASIRSVIDESPCCSIYCYTDCTESTGNKGNVESRPLDCYEMKK